MDWAAGEGICPTEEGVPSPDVPLFEFASKTGNEDYASYPDVISAAFGRLREAERERDASRAAALEEAAKVAEQTDEDGSRLWPDGPEIAAAIRAEAQKDGG